MHWLKEYIDYKGYSILHFEKSIGTRSTIDKAIKNSSNLRGNILAKIIEIHEDINPKWLITGKGNMLLNIGNDREVNFEETLELSKVLKYLLNNNKALMNNIDFKNYIKMNAIQLNLEETIKENSENLEKLRKGAINKYKK